MAASEFESGDGVDVNDDATSEKWLRSYSSTPKALKSQHAWDASYLYVSLQEFFYRQAINTWEFEGAWFDHSSTNSQLRCSSVLVDSMKMPFFGRIVLSKDGGKDIKGMKLPVAEFHGLKYYITPDPVVE